MMSSKDPDVNVTVRLPAGWSTPQEMLSAMPDTVQMRPNCFVSSDGAQFELDLRDSDDQFANLFHQQSRHTATAEETDAINQYNVQVCLTARCGDKISAASMCRAVSHFLDAGALGVFVDNSGVAFPTTAFRPVLNSILDSDADPTSKIDTDALTFAFISIVSGKRRIYTAGMHILGLHDLEIPCYDSAEVGDDLIEAMRYVASTDHPITDGDIIAILDDVNHKPKEFQVHHRDPTDDRCGPLQNPFGIWTLTRMKDIGEMN